MTGWLRALKDPRIGRCIAAIHRDPAHHWTVKGLATAAAMSRSSFAVRFAELVGKTPLEYVTEVRLHTASKILATEAQLTIEEVAARLGYQSEAAFSRAFRRIHGITPSIWRRAEPK